MKAYASNESSENYLESILMLSLQNSDVRSVDIANMLGFSKPSVSVAMKHLREEDKITVEDNGYIHLTKSGLAIARETYEKHLIISSLLMSLGVDEATASADACRIEHVLSAASFDRIKEHSLNPDTSDPALLQQLAALDNLQV